MRPSPRRSAPSPFLRLGTWLALFVALSAVQACATGGHAIRGTVTVVEPTRIEIRHKSGQRVSVGMSPRTSFRRGDSGASFNDVRVGGRVILVIDEGVSPFGATEIRIFSPARGASHRPVGPPQLSLPARSAYREQ